jgi:hypothetical protein
LQAANDNYRSPAEHRAIADAMPSKNPRPYRYTRWPQAERLAKDIGGKDMIEAMLKWRRREELPVMCVANDNYVEPEDAEAGEEPERRFDNIMDHDSADRTVALHEAGLSWKPGEERFDRPRRNDRAKAEPPPGQYKVNGVEFYQIEANAEDQMNDQIDHKNCKRRMGQVACHMMTLASGDSTTKEIAAAFKQPMSPRIETYIDWAIVGYMREAA